MDGLTVRGQRCVCLSGDLTFSPTHPLARPRPALLASRVRPGRARSSVPPSVICSRRRFRACFRAGSRACFRAGSRACSAPAPVPASAPASAPAENLRSLAAYLARYGNTGLTYEV